MKRLVILGGACALLGGVYAVWLERRRRLRAHEHSVKLQIWKAEGGNPSDTTSELGPG